MVHGTKLNLKIFVRAKGNARVLAAVRLSVASADGEWRSWLK